MPLPIDVEDAAERLSRIYGDALFHVRSELASIANETRQVAQQRRLRALARTLDARLREVDQQAKQWVDRDLPRVYERGMGDFISQTAAVTGTPLDDVQIDFTMPSRPAVERLGADLTDDLLQATQHVTRDSKRAIRSAVRSASLAKVVEGKSLLDARRAVTRQLEGLGIGTVRYRNGARMPLDAYAGMAVRTVTASAYNGGMLDAGRANGVEFFEVFDGPSCGWLNHDDADKAGGSIRTREDCDAHLVAHPHCRRSFGARPDLNSTEEAKKPEPATAPTPKPTDVRKPSDSVTSIGRKPPGARTRGAWPEAPPKPLPASNKTRIGVDRAMKAIDNLIDTPQLLPEGKQLPIYLSSGAQRHGQYSHLRDGQALHITVSSKAADPGFVVAHEFGHFFDHRDFGKAGIYESSGGYTVEAGGRVGFFRPKALRHVDPEVEATRRGAPLEPDWVMREVADTIAESGAVKTLFDMRIAPNKYRQEVEFESGRKRTFGPQQPFVSYLLQPGELWARAFSQWVAIESGDPDLIAQLRSRQTHTSGGVDYPFQWSDDDFEPIRRAISSMFRRMGLLR